MARFIDKPPADEQTQRQKRSLALRGANEERGLALPNKKLTNSPLATPAQGPIPSASIVYGIAAAVMLVIAIYNMFALANWFVGLLILILAGTLAGYAWYFMRYR